MSYNLQYTTINGIKCYSPDVITDESNFPEYVHDFADQNANNFWWNTSRNRLFQYLIKTCMTSSENKIKFLEIGCSSGNFTLNLIENKKLEITASEISLKGLTYAKNKFPTVDFIQYDVTQGIIADNFDVIIAADVIEHIDNDVAAIQNISRMLSPGGRAIISVPQYMFLWSRLDDLLRHKRRYTKGELLAKCRQNGLDVNFCTSFVFILFPIMLISRFFDKVRGQTQLDKEVLEQTLNFPRVLNFIFDLCMRIDEALIKFGISLPFGGTLLLVATKKSASNSIA